jgi:hypothetical protein
MPAPEHLIIPNTVQVSLLQFSASQEIVCVTHALIPSPSLVTVALADQIFNSLKALWATDMAPLVPTAGAFTGVRLRDLRQEGMPLVQSTTAAQFGTAAAADFLPRQIAACFTLRTARAGKKYRGRMFWGGFAESANGSDNHMTPAAKTAFDAFAVGFIGAYNVASLQLAVAHRPTIFDPDTGIPAPPGEGFSTPVTQVVCRDNVWDNQRRRSG